MAPDHELHFQFLAENSIDILCRTSPDTTLLYVSPSSLRILGWTPEEMTGLPATAFILEEDLPIVRRSIDECNAPGVDGVTSTIRFHRKSASPVWMEVNARAVRHPATGDPLEHVIVMRDITDRKLMEEKLAALAHTDGLTGLANRRAFDDVLDREWTRTLREGSQISLLLIDIDRFKDFNDRYGHQFGDDCLRAVSVAIANCVRSVDFTARYGGEEIAVILPDADMPTAVAVAERIRTTVEQLQLSREQVPGTNSNVTVSIGIATALARQGGTIRMPESLLLSADNALYKAKHGGRNQFATAQVLAQQPV